MAAQRLSVDEAEKQIFAEVQAFAGRFYGELHADLALGSGLIFDEVPYPIYNSERRIYQTRAGAVIVMSHECDIEPANKKFNNTDILIAPLASFEEMFIALQHDRDDVGARAFLGDLSRDRISQLMYLPTLLPKFPRGAVLYLNRITHTHVDEFQGARSLGALTAFGLDRLDIRLKNHLFREKADFLPMSPHRG